MTEKEKTPIERVKTKLWKFNYSVKDFSETKHVDFDLLVDGTIRVKVGTTKPKQLPDDCDVFAFVGDDTVVFITKPKNGLVESTSPYAVFGKK
jgi:hypothetical protein